MLWPRWSSGGALCSVVPSPWCSPAHSCTCRPQHTLGGSVFPRSPLRLSRSLFLLTCHSTWSPSSDATSFKRPSFTLILPLILFSAGHCTSLSLFPSQQRAPLPHGPHLPPGTVSKAVTAQCLQGERLNLCTALERQMRPLSSWSEHYTWSWIFVLWKEKKSGEQICCLTWEVPHFHYTISDEALFCHFCLVIMKI